MREKFVLAFDIGSSKLRAMVSIFGRETPVELEYKQIQKV